jgi:hypothetical protein
MSRSLEILLGLIDRPGPPWIAREDFEDGHEHVLQAIARMGFLVGEPGVNPLPFCSHCYAGGLFPIDDRFQCNNCRTIFPREKLYLYHLHLGRFLSWLAKQWDLRGETLQVDECLWQLGRLPLGSRSYQCFFLRNQPMTPVARRRLSAFQNALLVYGLTLPAEVEGFLGPKVSLLEVLVVSQEGIRVGPLKGLLSTGGTVSFSPDNGALKIGDLILGHVPLHSREYHMVHRLWLSQDRFVDYAALKRWVLEHVKARDTADEANFCQKIKAMLKNSVPTADWLISASNRGDGYRLRRCVDVDGIWTF